MVLAVVGALIIGVVPALKATSGALQSRLGQLSAGGGGGLRFGGMWTVIIVFQVALSVAFLPLAVSRAESASCGAGVFDECGAFETGPVFPADEYVTAQLGRDPTVPPRTAEERAEFFNVSGQLFEEVRSRIAAEDNRARATSTSDQRNRATGVFLNAKVSAAQIPSSKRTCGT